jgi:hypothetical protein
MLGGEDITRDDLVVSKLTGQDRLGLLIVNYLWLGIVD